MSANVLVKQKRLAYDPTFVAGLLLIIAAVVITGFLIIVNADLSGTFPYFFLLPWILGLLIVLSIPSVILYFQGKFSLANPIVFAVWSYFFPAFILGGMALSLGWSQPFFLSFIQDAETNLPWTMVIVMIGYAGLAVGYFLPVGPTVGRIVGDYFNVSSERSAAYFIWPGILLLFLGMLNSVVALGLGVIGFQGTKEIASYDGLIFLSTLFWLEGTFILWYVLFRSEKHSVSTYFAIGFLILSSLLKALFAGNRGSLLQSFIIVVLAFVLSGRALRLKQFVVGTTMFVLMVLIGMIYGTTFRNVRPGDSVGGISSYANNIVEAMNAISSNSSMESIEFGLTNLAERIDTVSSLAVTVANYEELAPYEESYGLNDNIRKDIITGFIPRVLWNDKPLASDAHRYGDLYFNYSENSFAMTPMGDLLRNFGVVGVAVGMMILGLLLRTMYRALIENRELSVARVTLYFMLLLSISYEAFYGLIFPYFIKILITSVVGILIVYFMANRIYGSARTAER